MSTKITKTRWFMPLTGVVLGAIAWASIWIGGSFSDGALAGTLIFVVSAGLFFGGRSETIRGYRGDGRDERFERLDVHATVIAGNVTVAVILACVFWEWAHGRDGTPFTLLGAVTGLTYLAAYAWMRWRG